MRDKWKPLIDDMNPRKAHPKRIPEVKVLKSWTIKGQVIKAMEVSSPTTHRKLFKALVAVHAVSDTPEGLKSVQKAVRGLHRDGMVTVDQSVRVFVAQESSTEASMALDGRRKYIFV